MKQKGINAVNKFMVMNNNNRIHFKYLLFIL